MRLPTLAFQMWPHLHCHSTLWWELALKAAAEYELVLLTHSSGTR